MTRLFLIILATLLTLMLYIAQGGIVPVLYQTGPIIYLLIALPICVFTKHSPAEFFLSIWRGEAKSKELVGDSVFFSYLLSFLAFLASMIQVFAVYESTDSATFAHSISAAFVSILYGGLLVLFFKTIKIRP